METNQPGNRATVYVVYNDNRKDFSDAERFGQIKEVFSSIGRVYNTPKMVIHARRVLAGWQDGDFLLMIGDPTLCAVCMAVVTEIHWKVNVLRWDRESFEYAPQEWNFYGEQPDEAEQI
jgi:hypothetical protein